MQFSANIERNMDIFYREVDNPVPSFSPGRIPKVMLVPEAQLRDTNN